jgi:hypothetical protein
MEVVVPELVPDQRWTEQTVAALRMFALAERH